MKLHWTQVKNAKDYQLRCLSWTIFSPVCLCLLLCSHSFHKHRRLFALNVLKSVCIWRGLLPSINMKNMLKKSITYTTATSIHRCLGVSNASSTVDSTDSLSPAKQNHWLTSVHWIRLTFGISLTLSTVCDAKYISSYALNGVLCVTTGAWENAWNAWCEPNTFALQVRCCSSALTNYFYILCVSNIFLLLSTKSESGIFMSVGPSEMREIIRNGKCER